MADIHVRIDDELHYEFKLMCLQKGITMTRMVDLLIREAVSKHDRETKWREGADAARQEER